MKESVSGRFFKKTIWIGLTASLFLGCQSKSPDKISQNSFPEFFKTAHRGAQGLMPENTIPSMKKAVDDGANFLEVDLYISKDNKVVVTHDPHIKRKISLLPDGSEIPAEDPAFAGTT